MPGTFTLRTVEANLTHNTDILSRMNPYCTFVVGDQVIKGPICKKGGKHPYWNDTITLPVKSNESSVLIEVMDHDKLTNDDRIGSFTLDLKEVQSMGQVSRWYPLTYKNKPAGELLLESSYKADYSSEFDAQNYGYEQRFEKTQPSLYQREQEMMSASAYPAATLTEEKVLASGQYGAGAEASQGEFAALGNSFSSSHERSQIITEQRQVVEPHTFTKQVESVEIRPVLKEIEVLEPVRTVKDVLATELVPVKKEIQITEPQVVKKQVEVMEPRLVTKTIQVVEDVPVMKEVEVVENVTIVKEVEAWEQRTFTKQVEITEQVPVMKQVTVTGPVTIKKAVEYVEPVTTTKTIVREIQQPVLVDEKITTTIGPATVVGVETEFRERQFVDRFSDLRVAEEKRVFEQEKILNGTTSTYETDKYLGLDNKLGKNSHKYY